MAVVRAKANIVKAIRGFFDAEVAGAPATKKTVGPSDTKYGSAAAEPAASVRTLPGVAAENNAPIAPSRVGRPSLHRERPASPATIGEEAISASMAKTCEMEIGIPKEWLYYLTEQASISEKENAARSPSCPAKVLAVLSADQSSVIRRAVAGNPFAPEQILERLSNDTDVGVKENLAANSASSRLILARLAFDRSVPVRMAVAANLRTPLATLETLSSAEEMPVRRCVA